MRTRPGLRRGAVVAAAVAAVLAVSGCDLRLETPPPSPLVPDAAEELRQRSALDAAAVADAADAATPGDEAAAAVLTEVAAAAQLHLDALGGVYDPGPPPGSDPTPTPTATATPEPPSVGEVVELLRATAASARDDAATVADPGMGRLLAAIAVHRALESERLAAVAGLPVPEGATSFEVPASLPAGLDASEASLLVQSEDALGLAWEVAAARGDAEARTRAVARARVHRERAEAWAVTAGLEGTADDPRRLSYALPDGLRAGGDDVATRTALSELEGRLAETYAGHLGAVDPAVRPLLMDAVLDSWRQRLELGATVPTFPAQPDLGA